MKQSARIGIVAGVIAVALLIVWLVGRGSNGPIYPNINSPRPVLGGTDAKFLVEEFSDFECPACGAAKIVADDVIKTFGDRIRFTYKHYPLVSIHSYAFLAAQASECANDQGKFWEYHDKLFTNQSNLSESDLKAYAVELKLNTDSFNACLDSKAKRDIVRIDMADGNKRGVNSTPSFFINGEPLADWSTLKEAIQNKLLGQ
jgi:protein-disulfide isomerase